MSLEDFLRWAPEREARYARGSFNTAPDEYIREQRHDEPNWGWVQLWEQENPGPRRSDLDEFDEWDEVFRSWWEQYRKVHDRVWVAYCLPTFSVWDWSDEDVQIARRLMARHVCAVCGRADDAGCNVGC